MPNYYAKSELVQDRQLKVQRLVIPFVITHNATAASVAISRDEPAILFLKTAGVDQIAAAVDGSPSQTSPVDASGIFDLMLVIGEGVTKVLSAKIVGRTAALIKNCTLDNTTGLSAAGDKILLSCDSAVNLTTTDIDACVEVEYVTNF